MARMRTWLMALAAVQIACGGTSTSPPSAPREILQSSHFRFEYPAADSTLIGAAAARLEQEYDRILRDLGVSRMPLVIVTFYADHSALVAAAGPTAGPIPSWANGLVTGVDHIHMLALSATGPSDRTLSNLVHEFAHCVSIEANRTIPNNPRWLWESVALYEARQLVDPKTISYMVGVRPPSFAQMNGFDNMFVYDVGYTIGEFVTERWGARALPELLVANGNTERLLQRPLAQFEAEWFAFTRDRYGF